MFRNCSSLTSAPALPATTMATSCYSFMFYHCTSLTSAPELPATTLASGCYSSMFNGCTSLATAPQLPATTMVTSCYSGMFNGCTSLNSVNAAISSTNLNSGSYTTSWLKDVASTGTFTYTNPNFDPSAITTRSASTVPEGWNIVSPSKQSEFYLMGNRVKTLSLNGKKVKTLFINGKQVIF